MSAKSARTDGKRRTSKASKAELTLEQRIQRKYTRLEAQINNNVLENALKTTESILRLDAGNTLVERTRIQLLLTLDRYNEALSACSGQSNGSFEHGYALYKLGRHTEALKIIENLNTAGDDRATKVLEAQVRYKNEDYAASKVAYDELLLSCELDSPEYADLETNLNACDQYSAFQDSLQDRLGEARAENPVLSDFASLESQPAGQLVAAHFKTQKLPAVKRAQTKKPNAGQPSKSAKSNAHRLPARIAEMPENERPEPDPERWLPKRERRNFVSNRDQKRDSKRKQREKQKTATQGSTGEGVSSTANASNAGGKKKKSGKR